MKDGDGSIAGVFGFILLEGTEKKPEKPSKAMPCLHHSVFQCFQGGGFNDLLFSPLFGEDSHFG